MSLKNARTDSLEIWYRNKAKAKISIEKFSELGSPSDILQVFQYTPEFTGLDISIEDECGKEYIAIDGWKIIDSYYSLFWTYGTLERTISLYIPNFIDYSDKNALPLLHENLLKMLCLYIKPTITIIDNTQENIQKIMETYQIPLAVTQIVPKILSHLEWDFQKYILKSRDFPIEEMGGEKLAEYLQMIPIIGDKYKMIYRESAHLKFIEFILQE